jgi:succinate dehydrogenase/fumarate reductase flavoprotein subunit
MKNLTEKYVNIDWSGICSDFDLKHGDISPDQSFEMDRHLGNINEILHAFINQNKDKPVELSDEEIVEIADQMDKVMWDNFHYIVTNVYLQRTYTNKNWEISDDDIIRVKNELRKYL